MSSPKSATFAKVSLTLLALALATLRVVFPDVKVDVVTVAFIALAALPWLFPFIKSAKLPGGWEITFRDVQAAGEKITSSGATSDVKEPTSPFLTDDPNLALVALRIEIERRIRSLSPDLGVNPSVPLRYSINELEKRGTLPRHVAEGLNDLITAGNSAARGASVDPSVSTWARTAAPSLLRTLDDLVEVTVGTLNLRTGPSTNDMILASIPRGSKLNVLENRGDWVLVEAPDGTKGWVASMYIANVGGKT